MTMPEEYNYSVVRFTESLKASFIGAGAEPDERYSPRILGNEDKRAANVLSTLKSELLDCASFDFSVAFVTNSGMQVLAEILLELRDRGIPGRILTSTYLNFNEPDALRKILEFPNIELRVYQGDLHAKGYFFNKEQISTIIIGSSNLTQKALTCNKEWNILFRSFPDGRMLLEAKEEYEKLWCDNDTVPVTPAWIDEYERFRKTASATQHSNRPSKAFRYDPSRSVADSSAADEKIKPNKMQESALEALSVLHDRNEHRALLISATGTGKTYLSALDVWRVRPKRVLFIAHRKRILSASMRSFKRVLGDRYSYGYLDSGNNAANCSCLFAMSGWLSENLAKIDAHAFDYVVIDEAHRAGGKGYRRILEYLKPGFILGMTATPTRTDRYDIYPLFNHEIAYRITLQDALENEMLTPFHYFGIADLEIDEEQQDDFAVFNKLTSEARVDHVIKKIDEYSVDKSSRRGLVFCSRVDEAEFFAKAFSEKGIPSVSVSGELSDAQRDDAIRRLEEGDISYIFSVDVLNEGVDIPSLNQIIMLRKTESAIVFVQQLGRGLRKSEGKDYTLVLDFIGNYQQNYLVPIALSGDRTYNKDALRKVVKEGTSIIPGCSTVTFDRIAEKRIFRSLEESRFDNARLIRDEYTDLKRLLGRIPRLIDFDENEAIDPLIIIRKYDSYPAFLQKYEKDCPFSFNDEKLAFLKFISTKLANGKREADLSILLELVKGSGAFGASCGVHGFNEREMAAACNMLTGRFSTAGQQLITDSGSIRLSAAFVEALKDDDFKKCVIDALEFGLHRSQALYADKYKDTDFVLYGKYTREDVARLLRWEKEPNYQNIGGYFYDRATNTFPVFIDYEKDPSISLTTQYEDRFVTDKKIIAISKSKRTLASKEIVRLRNAEEIGMHCYLFVRKNKDDKDNAKEFYFLGEMHPTGEFEEITMKGTNTSAVEIVYELETPVRADIYDYLRSSFKE